MSLNNSEIVNAMLQFALLAKHNLFRHARCLIFQTRYLRNTGESIEGTCSNKLVIKYKLRKLSAHCRQHAIPQQLHL